MSNNYRNSYRNNHKKGISSSTKNVILLFIFSGILTGAAVFFMQDKIPALKNEVETLKTEKQKKENELKNIESTLSEKEKSYNELKSKVDKK
ncbi:hypothetical protein [Pseudoleptotrichia goodfellowii]|uniref:Uncharacterized protein n=1 Tax=Pseudoleptotrichia goodfellowii TaxID=157692 RepID=A0A510J9H1_9FUSO|nr:hypothetical protein [Pseudoleptotrichia goodfellowii]BBM35706.1 hypothetical protein JCM16774_0635 [Pseudoleptotrichia goodfellowii]